MNKILKNKKTYMDKADNFSDVLYITYDGLLEPLGQSQIIPYLKKISDADIKYTVVSYEKAGSNEDFKKLRQDLSLSGIRQ